MAYSGERTSAWFSALDEALVEAVERVARSLQASPEEVADMLTLVAADDRRISRSAALAMLLRQAEQIVWAILQDAYQAQSSGKPVTMLGELDKMRQSVSEFSAQAGSLVQPRLIGSQWPRGQTAN